MNRIIFTILLTFFSFIVSADTVTLKNGDEIYGKITKISKKSVYLIDHSNKLQKLDKKNLLKVSLLNDLSIPGEKSISDIKDKDLIAGMKIDTSSPEFLSAGKLFLISDISLNLKSDGRYKYDIHKAIKILKERSRDEANSSFFYKKGDKAVINFGRTINDKNIYYLNEESVQDESPYFMLKAYDATMSKKFALPKVKIGSIIDYSFSVNKKKNDIFDPLFISYTFVDKDPVIKSDVRMKYADDTHISYFIRNNEKNKIKFTKKRLENNSMIDFSLKNSKGYEEETNMPPAPLIFPSVAFGVDYGIKNVLSKVNNKFNALIRNDKSIDLKLAEICKNISDTNNKIKAIYNYVVKQITLQPVPMEHYSYIPKTPEEIIKNSYANMLDKSFLFYAMLKKSGINAHFCYARSRREGPLYKIANLGQFSFTCVYLPDENKYIVPFFKDYALDEIPSSYQGAYILDMITGKFDNIPMLDPEKEGHSEKTKLKLNKNGDIIVESRIEYFGDSAAEYRALNDLNPMQIRKKMEQMVATIHPNAKMISYKLENIDTLDAHPIVTIKYSVKKFAVTGGDKYLVFRLPKTLYSSVSVSKPSRTYPIYFDSKVRYLQDIKVKLPDGYKVYYLPKSIHESFKNVSVTMDFKSGNDYIEYLQKYSSGVESISPDEYSEYKKLIEKRAQLSREWLVITK